MLNEIPHIHPRQSVAQVAESQSVSEEVVVDRPFVGFNELVDPRNCPKGIALPSFQSVLICSSTPIGISSSTV